MKEEEIHTDDDMSVSELDDEYDVVEEEEEEDQESVPAETNRARTKALLHLRLRVEEAINADYLFAKSPQRNSNAKNELWGVPLLPSVGHPGTDIVLTKFLKAKNYKVRPAFVLLRRALKWRAEFWASEIDPNEGVLLPPETDRLWFASGKDMEGRPMCYNMWGKESQKRIFAGGDQKYCQQYLRWKVLCIEKGIQNLNFTPGGASSIIQVIDLENSIRPAKQEAKMIYKKMISLLQNYYPGLVYKNLIINVPSWFFTLNTLNLRLITQKSRNKFIFVKPSKVTETLLEYATPENIPVQYGGLRREIDTEFSTEDKVLEVNIRANSTDQIQIPINEGGVTVTWDVTVVGYNVLYKEEFIPDDDCSYIILLQEKKLVENTRNTFHIREPGKIVMTIANGSFSRKKAFYRFKIKHAVPMFMLINQSTDFQ